MGLDVAREYRRINQTRQDIEKILEAVQIKLEKKFEIPGYVKTLKDIRIACVLDEFSFRAFEPECNLLQISPGGWKDEIESFNPCLLFVESAWKGKDDLWDRMISNPNDQLVSLVRYCNDRHIPSVFWNKEDPAHFNTFLSTAKLFDFVFTTDVDSIRKYKAMRKDGAVFLLPFAAQPRVHNPIETLERKDAFCFAGSYYKRYPERQRDFETMFTSLSPLKRFDIYDRYQGTDLDNYRFPDSYAPFIIGSLQPSEIDVAYKGYFYGLNMNTIKQSQSMFARRVFELMASNTIVVSNYSRGLRMFFGDLVISTDDGEEMVRKFSSIHSSEDIRDKVRLAALRNILSQHTYKERLAYIIEKVFNKSLRNSTPAITVIAPVADRDEALRVIGSYERQSYPSKGLLLLADTPMDVNLPEGATWSNIRSLYFDRTNPAIGEWIAFMHPDDYYGTNYLTDMMSAMKYQDLRIIGKGSYLESVDGKIVRREAGKEYSVISAVSWRSVIIAKDLLADNDVSPISFSPNEKLFMECFSTDRFNYCRSWVEDRCEPADDIGNLDIGIDMCSINRVSESITRGTIKGISKEIRGNEFLSLLPPSKSGAITLQPNIDGTTTISSKYDEDDHEYLYFKKRFKVSDLDPADHVRFLLDAEPGLNLSIVLFIHDNLGNKIDHTIVRQGKIGEMGIPQGAAQIHFALRVQGSGSAVMRGIVFGDIDESRGCHVAKGKVLAVVNQYPEYADLYRNAFIHSRVKAYKDDGVLVDVVKVGHRFSKGFYEFNGVDVVTSDSYSDLHTVMDHGKYSEVLVHFLNKQAWAVLKEYADKVPVIIWVHGFEIQPYHRREYNYRNEEERERAIKASEDRTNFWRGLFESRNRNVHFIFVSQYFSEEVMQDIGVRLEPWQYSIIHNFVDTDVFEYRPREEEDRLKLLSVRSFASNKYANDLTVKAIVALSSRPFFDKLEFHLVGDGALFEETVEPLRKFPNVVLERRFLSISEYRDVFKKFGVFLTPTRWDSQGVSRDEAMSTGMVIISNNISGVPEFVDETCGILVEPEDYQGMADAIERLYNDPKLFLQLSSEAGRRVRRQNGRDNTIRKELHLLKDSMVN